MTAAWLDTRSKQLGEVRRTWSLIDDPEFKGDHASAMAQFISLGESTIIYMTEIVVNICPDNCESKLRHVLENYIELRETQLSLGAEMNARAQRMLYRPKGSTLPPWQEDERCAKHLHACARAMTQFIDGLSDDIKCNLSCEPAREGRGRGRGRDPERDRDRDRDCGCRD